MGLRSDAIFGLTLAGLLIGPLVAPTSIEARDRGRDRYVQDDGWGPSVGRNAVDAIGSGLAEQGAGWIDTMANFYADPHIKNREYFDDYRRPYYGYRCHAPRLADRERGRRRSLERVRGCEARTGPNGWARERS